MRIFRAGEIVVLFAVGAVLLCMLAVPKGALGEETVSFDVTVVKASQDKGGGFDPALKRFQKQLKQLSYKTFRLGSRNQFGLAPGSSRSFPIAGRITGSIKLRDIRGEKLTFDLKISSRMKVYVNIGYRIARKGITIVVGPTVRGETHILIIRAR